MLGQPPATAVMSTSLTHHQQAASLHHNDDMAAAAGDLDSYEVGFHIHFTSLSNHYWLCSVSVFVPLPSLGSVSGIVFLLSAW